MSAFSRSFRMSQVFKISSTALGDKKNPNYPGSTWTHNDPKPVPPSPCQEPCPNFDACAASGNQCKRYLMYLDKGAFQTRAYKERNKEKIKEHRRLYRINKKASV